MNTLDRIVRVLPLVLPLALVAPLVSPTQVQAAAQNGEDGSDSEEQTYDYGARVKIEVRMEDGTVVKHRGEMRSFGNEWRFEFDGADHHHALTLNASGEEGDKKLEVTLAYERDGMAVIAPYKDTYPVRKRQSLWTQDGKLAIALTFIPTKFEREDTSRDDKEKIDPGDSDDPLGGNLFK
ncbi:hypothetical protein [Enhygromyxa salina]|nr:hypothetical protein [Enhygromyxa salina]